MNPLLRTGAVFRYDVGVTEQSKTENQGSQGCRKFTSISESAFNYHRSLVDWCWWCSCTSGPSMHIHNFVRTVQQQTHTDLCYLISALQPPGLQLGEGLIAQFSRTDIAQSGFGTDLDKWASGAGTYSNILLCLTLPVTTVTARLSSSQATEISSGTEGRDVSSPELDWLGVSESFKCSLNGPFITMTITC